ncbi:triose-phosphate isomerase [Chloroflexota bacterium]
MRTPMIAGNWKMNTTVGDALKLTGELLSGLNKVNNVEKVICPPFVSLATVADLIKDSPLKMGAQNMYFEAKGAYTGEISPLMIAGLCEYVIIGHSERRQYFHETGEIVNKKVNAALAAGLKPILCVGENLEDNELGKTEEVVSEQLNSSLAGIELSDRLVIAYEPIWAIGTGRAANGEQANETIGFIRRSISRMSGNQIAAIVRILYGGSVAAANTIEFMQQPEIDGALVGGASLKAVEFVSITEQTAELYRKS